MADIVKKNGGQMMEWDPMRAMRELMRWDPFREMMPSAAFPTFAAEGRASFNPTFDVTETQDGYVFKADVPGVKLDDLEITTKGNRLQIAGKRESEQEQKTDTVYTYERQHGSFTRSFTLPEGADVEHARSELKDGVLTLVIPKQASAQAKKIEVKSGAAKS
jgi:HSP20 family protein